MKKIIKFLAPVSAVVATIAPSMVSCGKNKNMILELSDGSELPIFTKVGDSISLQAIDKDTKKPIEDVEFSSDSESVVINDNEVSIQSAGQAIINCKVNGYNVASYDLQASSGEAVEYDLTQEFEPSTTPLGGKLEVSKATEKYLSDINANKLRFADDLYYTWKNMWSFFGWQRLEVEPVFVDIKNKLISMKFNAEGDDVTGMDKIRQEYEIKNIPVAVSYTQEQGGVWTFASTVDKDGKYLLNNSNWMYYQKDIPDGQDPVIHNWNQEKLLADPSQDADLEIILLGLVMTVGGMSYYLSETTPA